MDTEEKQAEFLSFCIESYKAMMGGISGMKIANFFEEFGVFDYLLKNYDSLHGLERQHLLNKIKNFLNKRGA